MAIETLGNGFNGGYSWTVDHDETAGTVGVSVTGSASFPGKLMLDAKLVLRSNGTVVWQWSPHRIDQNAGLGRQVLFTSPALAAISLNTLIESQSAYEVSIWTTYGP